MRGEPDGPHAEDPHGMWANEDLHGGEADSEQRRRDEQEEARRVELLSAVETMWGLAAYLGAQAIGTQPNRQPATTPHLDPHDVRVMFDAVLMAHESVGTAIGPSMERVRLWLAEQETR